MLYNLPRKQELDIEVVLNYDLTWIYNLSLSSSPPADTISTAVIILLLHFHHYIFPGPYSLIFRLKITAIYIHSSQRFLLSGDWIRNTKESVTGVKPRTHECGKREEKWGRGCTRLIYFGYLFLSPLSSYEFRLGVLLNSALFVLQARKALAEKGRAALS